MRKYKLTLQGKIAIGVILILILLSIGIISINAVSVNHGKLLYNNVATKDVISGKTFINNQNEIYARNSISNVAEKAISDKQLEEATIKKSILEKQRQSNELEKILMAKDKQKKLLEKTLIDERQDADLVEKTFEQKKNEAATLQSTLTADKAEVAIVEKALLDKNLEKQQLEKLLMDKKRISSNIEQATTTMQAAAINMQKIINDKKSEADKIEKLLTDKKNLAFKLEKLLSNNKIAANNLGETLEERNAEVASIEKVLSTKKTEEENLEKSIENKNIETLSAEKALSEMKEEIIEVNKQLVNKQLNVATINKTLDMEKNEAIKIGKQLKDSSISLKNVELNIEQKTKETKEVNYEFMSRKKELSLLLQQMQAANKTKSKGTNDTPVLVQTSASSSNSKKVDIFYSPHPDDEVLSMGMAIAECVKKGDEVHVVLLTHGYDSNAINILNGDVYCKWDHRKHNPAKEGYKKFTKQEMGNLRVKEFINSVIDLGVNKDNIHICNYDEDSVSSYEMKLLMLGFEKQYPGAYHQTTSYHDAHPFHRKLGETLLSLYNSKQIENAEFYISPVQWRQVNGTMESFGDVKDKVLKSLNDYKKWDPSRNEFGIGYHSYPEPFNINENQLSCKFHFAGDN